MDKDFRSPFARAAAKPTVNVTYKDNAAPRVPPPQSIRVPVPTLAPLGASSIRVPKPVEMRREASPIRVPKAPREVGKPSDINREFQSIVRDPGKAHGRDR